MTMHEHDQELIMALAEGSLGEKAAAAASAEISGCPECTRDLELQLIAVSALGRLPDVYLTAVESSRLHANLRRELHLEAPVPTKPQRTFAWGRWLPAAGIAAVFLAIVVSLPFLFGGGGDDSADMTAALDGMATTTTASAETTAAASAEALPPREGDLADDAPESLQVTEDAGGVAETTAAPETTTAADETTTTTGLMDPLAVLPPLGPIDELDRDALLEMLTTEEALAYSARALTIDPFTADCVGSNASAANAAALGLPEDSEPILVGIVYDDTGEEFLLVAYVPADVGETVFVTQRINSCEVVATLF